MHCRWLLYEAIREALLTSIFTFISTEQLHEHASPDFCVCNASLFLLSQSSNIIRHSCLLLHLPKLLSSNDGYSSRFYSFINEYVYKEEAVFLNTFQDVPQRALITGCLDLHRLLWSPHPQSHLLLCAALRGTFVSGELVV